MTRIDRISGLGILVLALAAGVQSLRMGLWKGGIPGPGLFPLVGAGGMALLAVLLIVTSRNTARDKSTHFWPRGDELKKQGVFALALLMYPVLTQGLGFIAGSLIFLVLLFRYPARYRWTTSLAVAALTVGILYASLVTLLGTELPAGLVEEWLPWRP